MNTQPLVHQAVRQLATWLRKVDIPHTALSDRIVATSSEGCELAVKPDPEAEQPLVAHLYGNHRDQHRRITLYRNEKPDDVDMVGFLQRYAKEQGMKVLNFHLFEDFIEGKCMAYNATILVDAKRVVARRESGFNAQDAAEVFTQLQKTLGYKPRALINRGSEAKNVRHNGSYGEDTIFRHKELRRCPNPTAADFKRYESVIDTNVRLFLMHHPKLCMKAGVESEDLRQYCLMWVTNFIGLYERPNTPQQENGRLCYRYLTQRFVELKGWLTRRVRNSPITIPRSLGNTQTFANDEGDLFVFDSDLSESLLQPEKYLAYPLMTVEAPDDTKYKIRKALYDTLTSGPRRRREATKVLNRMLSELSHEDFIARLSEIATNSCCDVDARSEAIRMLKKHAKKCDEPCRKLIETLVANVHKEMSRLDTFSM
jgi:hypothetical protein